MILTRHSDDQTGFYLALDGIALQEGLTLGFLLSLPKELMHTMLSHLKTDRRIDIPCVCPVEPEHEVWAAGVTYLRSRVEREAESTVADVYAKVYEAERPEIFFKATGRRVVGNGNYIRIRKDSHWNVPEPELTLVFNRHGEIVGYTAGNDVSSRSIEGENPLYLPQAKVYDGACAIGHGIVLAGPDEMRDLPISVRVRKLHDPWFEGEARSSQMKRGLEELVEYLTRETTFPNGGFLMTGTGIVPPPEFTLESGDEVKIMVGEAVLSNNVE